MADSSIDDVEYDDIKFIELRNVTDTQKTYYKDGNIVKTEDLIYIPEHRHTYVRYRKYYKNGRTHREGDNPASIEYYQDGNVRRESYFKNGELHREGDKPAVIFYNKNGNITNEEYFENNMLYHTIGFFLNDSGSKQIKFEIYLKNGRTHREGDNPATIDYYQDGNVRRESYYKNGELYREGDNPASIDYYQDGNVQRESYYRNGKLHREGDNPASIEYYQDGNVRRESYYKNGKLHREGNNPASIEYYQDGMIKNQLYYIDDVQTFNINIDFFNNYNLNLKEHFENVISHQTPHVSEVLNYSIPLLSSILEKNTYDSDSDILDDINLYDFGPSSQYRLYDVIEMEDKSMREFLDSDIDNLLFILKNERTQTYQVMGSSLKRLTDINNFFVQCNNTEEIFPNTTNIIDMHNWYINKFLDYPLGISFSCVKKIIDYLEKNKDYLEIEPNTRLFYMNNKSRISPISTIQSVQVKYGMNIFCNNVNLVGATHCGIGTFLDVYNEVNKPKFLQPQ